MEGFRVMGIPNNRNKFFFNKIIRLFLFFLLAAAFSFSALKVMADSATVSISDADIIEKSESVVINNFSFEGLKVRSDATFHNLNDYITYKITLKNNSDEEYILKSISNTSNSAYIDYECEDCANDYIFKPSSEISFKMTARYAHQIQNMSERIQLNVFNLELILQDENGEVAAIPDTGRNTLFEKMSAKENIAPLIIMVTSIIGLVIIVIKARKESALNLIFLATLIAVSASSATYAISSTLNLIFEEKYELADRVVVAVVDGDNREETLVNYGEEISAPENYPEKEGYNFKEWHVNGENVTGPIMATSDIDFIPTYDLVEYRISYELNGGSLDIANPTSYTIESENITLNNPTKQGYNFAGWTGSESDVFQTRVTIETGSTGPKSFIANYSAREDTPYKVIHMYKKLNSDDYVTEEEDLVGVTDTIVRPQTKSKAGFVNPELKNLTIKPNGQARLEYQYEREEYTLTYDDENNINLEESTTEGSYPFETPITVKAACEVGYTFSSWSDGSTDSTHTFPLTSNTTISPICTANTDTPYIVIHEQMKIDGNGYEEVERDELTGTTGEPVTPAVKNYPGFESPATQTVTINGNGSTKVTYQYGRNRYTLTLSDAQYIEQGDISGPYYYGSQVTLTAKTREGHTFSNWSNGETANEITVTMDDNISIEPIYSVNSYSVTFETNGGSLVTSQTITYGEKASRPTEAPTKFNAFFDDWYTNDSFDTIYDFDAMTIEEDTVIYANWIDDPFPIVFQQIGACEFGGKNGVISGENCTDYEGQQYIDTGVVLYNTDNYQKDYEISFKIVHFASDEQDADVAQQTIMSAKSTDSDNEKPGAVYRVLNNNQFEFLSRKTFDDANNIAVDIEDNQNVKVLRLNNNIYFSVNGSNYVMMQEDVDDIQTVDHSTWFGAAPKDVEGTISKRHIVGVLSDMQIRLGRYESANYNTVTFDARGGSPESKQYLVEPGKTMDTIPTPTKSQRFFVGWFTEEEGGEQLTDETVIEADTTYYARWANSVENISLENDNVIAVVSEDTPIIVTNTDQIDEPYSFASSDESIVIVDSTTGVITGISRGTTTVDVVGAISGKRVPIMVTVYEGRYDVEFDARGGNGVETMHVYAGETINPLPSTTKEGSTFEGWFTEPDGGEMLTSGTRIQSNITFYAHWEEGESEIAIVCKKATELHTETCSATNNGCYSAGYTENGTEQTDIITYGTLPSTGQPVAGDSYDCDVNNDNTFDANTERFYFVRENGENAVLVSHSNFEGEFGQRTVTKYSYDDALTKLPTATQWSNPSLVMFNGNPARILSRSELNDICGSNLAETGSLDSCNFLLEKTSFHIYDTTQFRTGLWLQNEGDKLYRIHSQSRYVVSVEKTSQNAIRPTIEIPMEKLQIGSDYLITFDANFEGSTLENKNIGPGETVGRLPEPTRDNYEFLGWFTEAQDGTKITKNTVPEGDTTYYAHWEKILTTVCEIAEPDTLHTSTCSLTSGGCYAAGYSTNGSKGTNIVTFGQIATSVTPMAGDAYNCDVNDDGEYDAENERFYYVGLNGENAVLVSHTNFEGDESGQVTSNIFNYNTALTKLPTKNKWTNENLVEQGEGYAARFLTYTEVASVCGSDYTSEGGLDDCVFLLENSQFVGLGRTAIWLAKDGSTFKRIHTKNRQVANPNSSSENVVRPAIEVPYTLIEKKDPVVFNTSNDATIDYYDTVTAWIPQITQFNLNTTTINNSTWGISESTLVGALKDDFEINDCLVPSYGDSSFSWASGTNDCSKPRGYDTELSDTLNVYLYNKDTQTIGSQVYYTKSTNGKIYNMIPGKSYYWESASDVSENGYVTAKAEGDRRIIDAGNVRNVRDLGGLKVDSNNDGTIDGATKYEKIFRGERLWSNSDNVDEIANLSHDNQIVEYDLRESDEGTSDVRLPDYKLNTVIHYDFNYGSSNYNAARNAVKSIMEDVVAGKNIYFHCRVGADRTGTIAYLLEGLLGVSDEERYEDYELTYLSGLTDRTRYYKQKPNGSISPTLKFVYMMSFVQTNQEIYDWYMAGSNDSDADNALIQSFKNEMINAY